MTPAWALAAVNWLATAAAAYLALLAWRHPQRVAREIVGLAIMVAEWSLCSGFEVLATDEATRLLWTQIGYVGIYGTPVFAFRFCIKWLRPDTSERWLWLLWAVPLVMVVAAFTNSRHHTLWTSISPSEGHPSLWRYEHGPLFWVGTTYVYVLVVAGFSLLLAALRIRRSVYRKQVAVLIVGTAVPLIANIAYVVRLLPETPLDLTPIAFTIAIVIYLFGISEAKILDLVPAARSSVVSILPDGVLLLDRASRILDWNRAALDLCGAEARNLMGTPVSELLPQWRSIGGRGVCADTTRRFIASIELPTQERRVLEITVRQVRAAGPLRVATVVLMHDMSDMARVQEQLRNANERLELLNAELHAQAIHDPLTGYYNRYHMDDALEHEIERARRYTQSLGLVIMDMDGFKSINDRYGHPVGDEVLRAIAGALRDEVRSVDVLCRFGGDEFVIIMPGASAGHVERVSMRLKRRVAELDFRHGEDTIRLALSVGSAVFPTDGENPNELFRTADAALLAAKAALKSTGDSLSS